MGSNLASYLKRSVDENPDKLALVVPLMDGNTCHGEESISFRELSSKVSAFQKGWERLNLKKGDRVIVLFRPSIDLYATVCSLLALGMVPVFIDTGMPKKKILMALQDSDAKVIISLRPLIRMFWIIPSMWRMKRFAVEGSGFGYRSISWLKETPAEGPFNCVPVEPDDHGLISFTSGSTGRPKGADRTQASVESQHLILRDHLPDREGDIDMTSFPVWVLHNLSCGMTTIIPKVDLARPGDILPDVVAEQIEQQKVTRLGAAPAFMDKLTCYLQESGKTMPDINLVFTGGATVPLALADRMKKVFPNAVCKVVYGSTEAEPISSVQTQEFVADAGLHKGFLVGSPVKNVEVRVASLPDRPVTEAEVDNNTLEPLDVGEILVSGEHVLKAYVDNIKATQENKVARANGNVWHRTGDTGFFDEKGRIWLTGRVKDVIRIAGKSIQPFPIEKAIDEMKGIKRAALVQQDDAVALFVEPGIPDKEAFFTEIAALFNDWQLKQVKVGELDKVPVDARHNSKIDRPLIRKWMQDEKVNYIGVIS